MLKITVLLLEEGNNYRIYNKLLKFVSNRAIFNDCNISGELKKHKLFGDLLARLMISQYTGLNNNDIIFTKNKYGKPYLNDCDIYFNISHSGTYVVCALSNSEIGIDVEVINRKFHYRKIMERVFLEAEKQYVLSSPENMQLAAFFTIWTMKESYIKYHSIGLRMVLSSFDVLSVDDVVFKCLFSNDISVCHLCSNDFNESEQEISFISEQDFLFHCEEIFT